MLSVRATCEVSVALPKSICYYQDRKCLLFPNRVLSVTLCLVRKTCLICRAAIDCT